VFTLIATVRGRELAGGSRGWLVVEGLLGIAAGIIAIAFGILLGLALRLQATAGASAPPEPLSYPTWAESQRTNR
jgi:hypothetical protein